MERVAKYHGAAWPSQYCKYLVVPQRALYEGRVMSGKYTVSSVTTRFHALLLHLHGHITSYARPISILGPVYAGSHQNTVHFDITHFLKFDPALPSRCLHESLLQIAALAVLFSICLPISSFSTHLPQLTLPQPSSSTDLPNLINFPLPRQNSRTPNCHVHLCIPVIFHYSFSSRKMSHKRKRSESIDSNDSMSSLDKHLAEANDDGSEDNEEVVETWDPSASQWSTKDEEYPDVIAYSKDFQEAQQTLNELFSAYPDVSTSARSDDTLGQLQDMCQELARDNRSIPIKIALLGNAGQGMVL